MADLSKHYKTIGNPASVAFALGVHENQVAINFQCPITTIGFSKDQARTIAAELLRLANTLEQ